MGITSDVVEETPYEEIIEPTCPSCRQSVEWEDRVCPHCGFQLKGEAKPKEAASKAVVKKRRKGKRGTVVAVGSVIALGILAFLSLEYWPPAILILLLAIVAMVTLAAAPETG